MISQIDCGLLKTINLSADMTSQNLTDDLKAAKRHFLISVMVCLALASCNSPSSQTTKSDSVNNNQVAMADPDTAVSLATDLKPSGPKPDWAPSITPSMQTIL